jgi:hypothetical protein
VAGASSGAMGVIVAPESPTSSASQWSFRLFLIVLARDDRAKHKRSLNRQQGMVRFALRSALPGTEGRDIESPLFPDWSVSSVRNAPALPRLRAAGNIHVCYTRGWA